MWLGIQIRLLYIMRILSFHLKVMREMVRDKICEFGILNMQVHSTRQLLKQNSISECRKKLLHLNILQVPIQVLSNFFPLTMGSTFQHLSIYLLNSNANLKQVLMLSLREINAKHRFFNSNLALVLLFRTLILCVFMYIRYTFFVKSQHS